MMRLQRRDTPRNDRGRFFAVFRMIFKIDYFFRMKYHTLQI
jgi:hypothetical protein